MATTAPRGISAAGVVSRITVKPVVISGVLHGFFGDFSAILQRFLGLCERGRTVTRCPRRSQAGRVGLKRMQSGAARLTGCLTAGARAGGRTAGRAGLPI